MDKNLLQAMTDAIVGAVHPDEIVLFGSYARGDECLGSDLDLLVVVPDSEEMRCRRRKITGLLYRRLAVFPVAKDILLFTRSEMEHWRNVPGHVVATSIQEGRRLYARP